MKRFGFIAIIIFCCANVWAVIPNTGYSTQSVTAGSSITDFTLLVDLSDMPTEWWAEVDTSDGSKGRTYKEDLTELAVDWISFDDTAETGFVRVLWSSTLSGSVANTIRIYPPVAANDSVAASATFGAENAYNADWVSYWPLDEDVNTDVGGYVDRTDSDLDGQGTSMAITAPPAQIGIGAEFDGAADFITIAGTFPTLGQVGSISFWASSQTTATSSVTAIGFNTLVVRSEQDRLGLLWSNAGGEAVDGPVSFGTEFHHIFLIGNGTALEAFVDGVSVDTGDATSANTETGTMGIGARVANSDRFYDGVIDDLQIHDIDRPDAWIVEEFNQGDDNAVYWGTWTWTPASSGLVFLIDGGVTRSRLINGGLVR